MRRLIESAGAGLSCNCKWTRAIQMLTRQRFYGIKVCAPLTPLCFLPFHSPPFQTTCLICFVDCINESVSLELPCSTLSSCTFTSHSQLKASIDCAQVFFFSLGNQMKIGQQRQTKAFLNAERLKYQLIELSFANQQ